MKTFTQWLEERTKCNGELAENKGTQYIGIINSPENRKLIEMGLKLLYDPRAQQFVHNQVFQQNGELSPTYRDPTGKEMATKYLLHVANKNSLTQATE